MRRPLLGGAITLLALMPASAAIAKFSQTSHITLTTDVAGRSSGISASVRSSNPTAPGTKPKRATRLVIAFPGHTRFNLGTPLVGTCTLTDRQITKPFGPSCPHDSQIGTGSALLNAMPMAPKPAVDGKVKVFVSGADSILIVLFNNQKLLPGTPPIIIHAAVSGSQLTMRLPHVVSGSSHKYKYPGITAVIVSLKLNIPAMGSGSDALVTSGSCTAKHFVVTSRFTYADHTEQRLQTRSSCS